MTAIPDGIWDFGDLASSEDRFRALLEQHPDGPARSEILTQIARIHALRGEFEAGHRLVDRAETMEGADVAARTRVLLERGRLLRSSGRPEEAYPLFGQAFDVARKGGEGFLTGDAAHMAALAAPDHDRFVAWTDRGIDLATSSGDPGAAYWLGPLLNNLGWQLYEQGRYEEALDVFRRALQARERDPEKAEEIEIARYAVGKALRALGRASEAVPLLERSIAWTVGVGKPDGWYHEELAEEYAALGRGDEASEHAALAIPLLEDADPSFGQDEVRSARLRDLAAGRP
jgi:tetratricopeptide (TPR) repeat protein